MMTNEAAATFVALLDAKIPYLRIAIDVSATNAKRTTPVCGIWEMTRERFLVIAKSLQRETRFNGNTIREIAQTCDETGIGNRFFRLSPAVAAWLDRDEPVATFFRPFDRVKIFAVAHLPDALAQAWPQHLRDFDTAHPGCHFEVMADAPAMSLAEVVEAVRLTPALTFTKIFTREGSDGQNKG